MSTATAASWEHKNDFFSIAIRESADRPGTYVFSSGLSLPRFNPIIWGRTGICSNAAFKGLQQLRADASLFALQRGIVTKNADPSPGTKAGQGHGWYEENPLLIEDASPEFIEDLFAFSSWDLLQTVLTACHPDVRVPAGMDSAGTQRFLESLGIPNYREMAPPPIAKPKAA